MGVINHPIKEYLDLISFEIRGVKSTNCTYTKI